MSTKKLNYRMSSSAIRSLVAKMLAGIFTPEAAGHTSLKLTSERLSLQLAFQRKRTNKYWDSAYYIHGFLSASPFNLSTPVTGAGTDMLPSLLLKHVKANGLRGGKFSITVELA